MKRLIPLVFALVILSGSSLFAQASVGYYPWNSLLTVSTNPTKALWFDTRVQTNSLFSGLSFDLLPMFNIKRGKVVQYYLGGGIRINPLLRIADPKADLITVDGYSINVGARIAPIPQNRNIQFSIELNPYIKDDLESGVLKSNFGLIYFFGKRVKQTEDEIVK